MDHDQRFKAMIREFFPDFMQLFFPEWAKCFDLSSAEWLDKEMLPSPPDGDKHILDLVAKLQTTDALAETTSPEWLALIHIEIEAQDKTTELKPRLPGYYLHLRSSQGLPVLPIVMYLNVGLDGIGIDSVEEKIGPLTVLTYRYLYVGLPALDAVEYVRGDNCFGIALSALMKAPRESWPKLRMEALMKLADANMNEYQRFLLVDCIAAYSQLDATASALYERMKMSMNRKIIPRYVTPFEQEYRTALAEERQEGREEALVQLVIAQLESKFQTVPQEILTKCQDLSQDQAMALSIALLKASSLEELFPPSE
jgi:hypothetical protein